MPRNSRHPGTLVAVTDRDAWDTPTDNIVLVQPARRRLLWLPRDLWSDVVGDRLNTAFARGGHRLLVAALAEFGLGARASVCFRRSAAQHALSSARTTVPVNRRLAFWYPLEPTARLEDGRKLIVFEPPHELLAGERLHQWIGARYAADGRGSSLPDLDRIARQQVLVRRLLEEDFPFVSALEDGSLVSFWNRAGALADLGAVTRGWRLETFPRMRSAEVDGKRVLVARRPTLLARLASATARVRP